MRKLRPFTAPLEPKTFSKKRLAAICLEALSSATGTAAIYATLARMYRIATMRREIEALFRMVLTGFYETQLVTGIVYDSFNSSIP